MRRVYVIFHIAHLEDQEPSDEHHSFRNLCDSDKNGIKKRPLNIPEILNHSFLPTCFFHTGQFAFMGQFTETDSAQLELA